MSENIPAQLSREQQSLLNNLRAIIKRQLRLSSTVEPALLGELILKYSALMREGNLAQELHDYLEQVRMRVADGSPLYARLTAELARCKEEIGLLHPEAETTFQEALQLFDQLDPEVISGLHAEVELAYGRYLMEERQPEKAAPHFHKALALLEQHGTTPQVAAAFGEIAHILVTGGFFKDATDYYEKALSLAAEHHTPAERATLLIEMASALLYMGEPERAEIALHEGYELANNAGLPAQRGEAARLFAYLRERFRYTAQNAEEQAAVLNDSARLLNEAIGDLIAGPTNLPLATAYHDLGRIEILQRRYNNAISHLQTSHALFVRLGDRRSQALVEMTLGQAAMLNGDSLTANQYLHSALRFAIQNQDRSFQEDACETLVRFHRIQSKRAVSQPLAVRQKLLAQMQQTRAVLAELKFQTYLNTLEPIIGEVSAVGIA